MVRDSPFPMPWYSPLWSPWRHELVGRDRFGNPMVDAHPRPWHPVILWRRLRAWLR